MNILPEPEYLEITDNRQFANLSVRFAKGGKVTPQPKYALLMSTTEGPELLAVFTGSEVSGVNRVALENVPPLSFLLGVSESDPVARKVLSLDVTPGDTEIYLDIAEDQRPPPGPGYLSGEFPEGITTIEGVPTPATIRILYRPEAGALGDGVVVATTQSGPDGAWRVDGLDPNLKFDVIGRKDGFNDVIVAGVTPALPGVLQLTGGFSAEGLEVLGSIGIQGGTAPFTLQVTGLTPPGVTFYIAGASVLATGTATEGGEFDFTLRVSGADGSSAEIHQNFVVGDPHWQNVVLLMRFDGNLVAEVGGTFAPYSGAPSFVASPNGQAIRFAGVESDVNSAKGPVLGEFDRIREVFTIEAMVDVPPNTEGTRVYLSSGIADRSGSGRRLHWWVTANSAAVGITVSLSGAGGSTSSLGGALTEPLAGWTHVAVCRYADGTAKIFVGGKQVASGNLGLPYNLGTSGVCVGMLDYPGYRYPFLGSVDEARVTRGIARYSQDFTPPTKPFPAGWIGL